MNKKQLLFLVAFCVNFSLFAQDTWYSYKTGNWNSSSTWTLDGSVAPLLVNPSNEVPGVGDHVVVTNGRTVTIDVNSISIASIEVEGRLVLSTFTGHNFTEIKGNGVIRMSGDGSGNDNFPSGTTTGANGFANVNNGGTLELTGTGINLDQTRTFNNVKIKLDATINEAVLLANYTINGDLTVTTGRLKVNNTAATSRTINLYGDMVIASAGQLTVGTGNARHQFNFYGDFTNNGTAKFSQRTTQTISSEATNGIVDANFLASNADQTVNCNGLTYFYRVEIDKGVDDTYSLFLNTTDASNFVLTGPANYAINDDIGTINFTLTNGRDTKNPNALGLKNGTVVLGTDVNVAPLSTGSVKPDGAGPATAAIFSTSKIQINGGSVSNDASDGAGGTVLIYGELQVTEGAFSCDYNGITMRGTGTLRVEGGTVDIMQFRTSALGSGNIGGYVQTGGIVTVDISTDPDASGNAQRDYATFSLTYPDNVFIMSGGTLHVKSQQALETGSNSGLAHGGLIFINSDPGNQQVTGGTVIAESSNDDIAGVSEANVHIITSRAPFYNLIIRNTSADTNDKIGIAGATSGSDVAQPDDDTQTLTAQDLIVLNDLTIETGTTRTSSGNTFGAYLDLCPNNTDCANVEIGGNLTINDSGVLDIWAWNGSDNDGSSTVTFNGSADATLYVGDITTYKNALVQYQSPDAGPWPSGFGSGDETYGIYTLPFYTWVIDKPGATLSLAAKLPSKGDGGPGSNASLYKTSNGGKNLSRYAVRLIQVTNDFQLLNGTLSQIDPNTTLQQTESGGASFGTVGDVVAYGMYLQGSITNYGTCFTYADGTRKEGTVNIRTTNDVTINSNEGASFGNLEMNLEGYEVTLTSDLTLGRFQYASGIMDIGTYNLKIDEFEFLELSSSSFIDNVAGQGVYNVTDYIRMAGNASDGGLSIKMPRSLTPYTNDPPSFSDAAYTQAYNIVDRSEYYLDGVAYNYTDRIWFPIGTSKNTERYTPALMHIVDESGVTYSGDEYVTVRVVDSELQTTDLSGGDALSYYWSVTTEGFDGGAPSISWIFQYDDSDVVGTEANYVPGKVLNDGTYQRSYDGTDQAVKEGGATGNNGNLLGTNPTNVIMFNGVNLDDATTITITDVAGDELDTGTGDALYTYHSNTVDDNWSAVWPGVGFPLENADYTAGEADRFLGTPQVFYSRNASPTNWTNTNAWSLSRDGGAAGDYPQAGDIAVLTRDNGGGGDPTSYGAGVFNINNGTGPITIAKLVFDDYDPTNNNWISGCPRVIFDAGGSYSAYNSNFGTVEVTDRHIDGSVPQTTHGAVIQYNINGSYSGIFPGGDFGDFNKDENALVIYRWDGGTGTATLSSAASEYPLLWFEGGNSTNRIVKFPDTDVTVNGKTFLNGNMLIRVNNGASRTLTFKNDVVIGSGCCGSGFFEFIGNSTGNQNVVIEGSLSFNGTNGGQLRLVSNSGSNVHSLTVNGNIVVPGSGTMNLGNGTNSVIELEVGGSSNNTLTNSGSVTLYRLIVNKGVSNTFSLDDNFNLPAIASTGIQPIEILNGTLIINDPAIDITLTNASTGNFNLPNTDNLEASSGSGGLQIQDGTVRIEGDNTGLILDGILTVNGGTLNMSTGVGNGNNFIQYSTSGNAEIDISSGNLNLGAGLRRSTSTTSGVLKYSQSGGTVTIAERNGTATPSRGVFEITNTGSDFTHTGGSLSIINSNNSMSVPSVLIEPETSDVSSVSTIIFANTSGNDNMGLKSNITLNNIELNGSTVANPTVKLYDRPLTLAGNLTIDSDDGSDDIFDANGYDVTFTAGNLINNGSYLSSASSVDPQTTTFSSTSAQSFSGNGTSTLYNLTKSGIGGTLTTSVDMDVENVLYIQSGTFATGSQAINVFGDVVNNSIHTSTTEAAGTLYGIVLTGSETQKIQRDATGISTFGALAINNPEGVLIEDETYYTFNITNKLILQQGVLDISSNLLVIGEDAVIENASGNSGIADFSANNMVQTNSSFTDFGLRKKFNTGVQTDFVFPIGQLLYTPVALDMTAGLSGTNPEITVRPSNEAHPTINDHDNSGSNFPGTLNDQNNVLQYHWIVTSSGVTNFNGNLSFQYDQSDVSVQDPGDASATVSFTEANYAGARLLFNDSDWDKGFDESTVDDVNNIITFSETDAFSGVNDDFITGDYTAGLLRDDSDNPLDIGAIPNTVPEYETINSVGSFDDNTNWLPVGGSPTLGVGQVPTGAIITIKSGDELLISSPNARIYRTVIESGGTLSFDENADNTRLGIVSGNGNIKLSSSTPGVTPNLPAGYYADFFASDCSGGGLEYTGSANYEVLAGVPVIREVVFSGTGQREMSNADLTVCEDFILRGNVEFVNSNDRDITISGDVIKADNAILNMGSGKVTLAGTAAQIIAGDFTGVESFYNLEINNSAGVSIVNASSDAVNGISADINGDVHVSNQLALTSGIVQTNTSNTLKVLFDATILGGSATAYINGPLVRELDSDAAGDYKFPVGNGSFYGRIDVVAPTFSGGGFKDWTAAYKKTSPTGDGFDVSNFNFTSTTTSPTVSKGEYWLVETATGSGTTSRIRLRWSTVSDVDSEGTNTQTAINKLRIMSWNGSQWNETVGTNTAIASGPVFANEGTLFSTGTISYSSRPITFGSTNSIENALPITLASFVGQKEENSIVLTWSTVSESDNDYFDLQRSANGIDYFTIAQIAGNGKSIERINYEYTDNNPLIGKNYYRLIQYDFDGQFEVLDKIVLVDYQLNFEELDFSVFPNPTKTSDINIRIKADPKGDVNVTLQDLYGRLIAIKTVQSSSLYEVIKITPNKSIPAGIYLISVEQFGTKKSQRLVITE